MTGRYDCSRNSKPNIKEIVEVLNREKSCGQLHAGSNKQEKNNKNKNKNKMSFIAVRGDFCRCVTI